MRVFTTLNSADSKAFFLDHMCSSVMNHMTKPPLSESKIFIDLLKFVNTLEKGNHVNLIELRKTLRKVFNLIENNCDDKWIKSTDRKEFKGALHELDHEMWYR